MPSNREAHQTIALPPRSQELTVAEGQTQTNSRRNNRYLIRPIFPSESEADIAPSRPTQLT
jgi:hypothetical protein